MSQAGIINDNGSGPTIPRLIEVDAFTPPGTNPVTADGTGTVTVTGGQVAAGTTTNVIRTDSLADHSYTIQVQRSQAVASSTVGDNGVSHFNSAQFTVDANAFVSIVGGAATTKIGVDANTAPGTDPVLPDGTGLITVTGAQVAAGTTANVIRTDSLAANEYTIQVQRSQAVASSTLADNGVCHFDSASFTVDANGFVSSLAKPTNYTNVTNAMSPYTVLASDYYISVDSSGGAVTLRFPNAPTFKQIWIIKDRTGNAGANNITITTVGGAVTIDGSTSFTLNANFESINLLANATPTYEVF